MIPISGNAGIKKGCFTGNQPTSKNLCCFVGNKIPGVGGGLIPNAALSFQLDTADTGISRVGGDSTLAGGLNIGSYFNGTSQYFDATASISAFNAIGTGLFSMAIRFNTADRTTTAFASTGPGNGNDFEFRPQSNGRINFRTQGSVLSSDVDINNVSGVWRDVLITSSGAGGTLRFYVDGQLSGGDQVAQNYNITGQSNIYIGSRPSSVTFFNGFMCDFRLWDKELTANEALAWHNEQNIYYPTYAAANLWLDGRDISNITASLVTSGTVSLWEDKSGEGNHVEQLTPALEPSWDGQTVSFDAGKVLEKTAQQNMLSSNGKFTLAFIHNVLDTATSTSAFLDIFQNLSTEADPASRRRPSLFYNQAGDALVVSDNSTNSTQMANASTKTGSQVLSVVCDGTTIYFYRNGVLENSGPHTVESSILASVFKIGDISNQNLPITYDDIIFKANDDTLKTREDFEGTLSWKKPIALSTGEITDPQGVGNPGLPVGHTWKNTPPIGVTPLVLDGIFDQTFDDTFL